MSWPKEASKVRACKGKVRNAPNLQLGDPRCAVRVSLRSREAKTPKVAPINFTKNGKPWRKLVKEMNRNPNTLMKVVTTPDLPFISEILS